MVKDNVLDFKVARYNETVFVCFRNKKHEHISYLLPKLDYKEAKSLLKHIQQGFKNDIGTTLSECDIMYDYVQKFLNDNNICLNVVNVEDKYYNEEFDEFLCDNYFKSY